MQHQTDQYGNLMPKAQTGRLLAAGRTLNLEKEISRLEGENRDLRSKCEKCAHVQPLQSECWGCRRYRAS
jgi:hypothetical protein